MVHSEAYLDFFVYEDGDTLLDVASVTLPDIAFMSATLTGAGVGGTVETPLVGMLEAMTMTMNFKNALNTPVRLAAGMKHNLTLRAAGQHWDTSAVDKGIWADRYDVVACHKKVSLGSVAPAAQPDASGEYSVYYLAAYKDGKKLMEIDPFNQICEIDGVDYMADVRKALGRA